jgi:peptidyl-prolyl cis-trans isomerase B (cyclophilin B)
VARRRNRFRARDGALPLLLSAALALACTRSEDVAELEVENYGAIRLRFFPDAAPRHVENFKKLVGESFYDGTTFHRVSPGFMIQGGDPNSKDSDPANDGMGGPGYSLDPEPNDLRHVEGSVAMAHGEGDTSSGSQFFIVLRSHDDWKTQLDGQYTVFGEVSDGLEIARKIAWAPRDDHNRPLQPVIVRSIRIVRAPVKAPAKR